MENIRLLRSEDKGRVAEIYVFNNRLNYYPIFHDDGYSFGEMQVISVAEDFAHWVGRENETFVLDDGVIRGFAVVGGGELHKLYIDPCFQGGGYGEKLLAFAVQKGARSLWALEKNTRAIAFYARHGFAPTGERQYEEGTTEGLIRLSFSQEKEENL